MILVYNKERIGEPDEEFKKRMKDAYESSLLQGANIGKVM